MNFPSVISFFLWLLLLLLCERMEVEENKKTLTTAWLYCHSNSTWIADILPTPLVLWQEKTWNYVISRKKPIEFKRRPFMQYERGVQTCAAKSFCHSQQVSTRKLFSRSFFSFFFPLSFRLLLYNSRNHNNSHSRNRSSQTLATRRTATSVLTRVDDARHGVDKRILFSLWFF